MIIEVVTKYVAKIRDTRIQAKPDQINFKLMDDLRVYTMLHFDRIAATLAKTDMTCSALSMYPGFLTSCCLL